MPTNDAPELDARPQSRREWSGYLRSLVLPLGLVVAIVGGLLWYQSRGSSVASDGYGTVALPAAKNATSKSPGSEVGRAAPDFELQTLSGDTVRLSDLQGQPVLVNFWASWCTSCRAETPDLIQTYEQHKQQGLVVIGVDVRESEDRVRGHASEFGVTFPLAFDRRGDVSRTWRIAGPSDGLPASYFIDRAGVVRKVVFGTLTTKLMNEGLDSILKAAG